MTAPGAGQNINLAALWIPVMPETSHMGEEMKKAGAESKRKFEEGFNSGTSAESIGSSFGSKVSASISKELKGFELPLGMSSAFERFGQGVDTNVIQKLRGEASSALSQYRSEYDKLTEATERATQASTAQAQAEANVKLAHDNGISAAQVMLPLMEKQTVATRENVSAQENLKSAHTSTGAALEDYNGKVTKLSSVTKEAGSASSLMAGVMGGVAVAAAQQLTGAIDAVVEHIIEGAVEAFKMGIDGAKEFADKMIELGESYEHIGIQITEFSNLSGEAFESTEKAAQQVFSNLDVAGKNTGQTMAQLATILDVPGESIKGLVTHVEELQGRFASLKTTDLTSIFVAFKTPAQEADSALASLLQNARNSGQDLGQLTSALSGNVAVTLSEAGLNLQQAGAFMGDLMKLGEPGRQTMTGMTSAMKEFSKEGLTFSDGMKLTGQRLKELGDTAEGQGLAEKLFGTRNWIVAKNAVQDYLGIVQQGPDAFNASANSLDDFIVRTRTLQNEWEMVKHRAAEAFLPMGEEAVKLVGSGLDTLVGYVNQHMDQIKHAVILGGLVFIQFAAQTQKFAEGLLDFFAPVVNGIDTLMGAAIGALGDFATAAGEVISWIPGMHDMGDGLIQAGNGADKFGKMLTGINVGQGMKDISSWLKQHPIDVQGASESWVHFAENVDTSMDSANRSVTDKSAGWFQHAGAPGAPGGVGAPDAIPGAPGGGGAPSGGGGIFAGSGPGSGMGGGATALGTGAGSGGNKQLAQKMFPNYFPESEWNAFDSLEMKEAGYNASAQNPSSTAYGMGQFLDTTWGAYGAKTGDPATQLDYMFRYIKDRYGTPGAAWAQYYQHPNGVGWYAKGGAPGRQVVAGSGNGDDVPAMLGRGEYVWDTDTVDKYGWLIAALHSGGLKGFDSGGPANGSANYVAAGGKNDDAGVDPQIKFAEQIANGMGLTLTAGQSGHGTHQIDGGWHDSGQAGDFSNGMQTDQELAFAMYMIEHFGSELAEVIHSDPRLPKLIKDGKLVDPLFYGQGTLDEHKDHVHIAIKSTQAMSDLSPGSESLSAGLPPMPSVGGAGTTPGGKNGYAYPGMAGQYGGSGVYGGETSDQAFSAQQAVQSAQDRQTDLDYQVQQNQKKIDDLKTQLAQVGNDPAKVGDLTGKPLPRTPAEQAADDAKRKQLNDELDTATHQLAISQRDQSEQGAKVTEAQRKQQEDQYKKPSTTTQSAEGKAGETLGSGLLAGIGQELGLGDVLGKSPMDWGIVKLAEGLLNYGNGLGDAIFGKSGSLGGPGGSGGLAGGVGTGLLGSIGIKLPNAGVSAGSNVIPVPVGSPASGMGTGTPPGPPVINNDNSVTVQAGVTDKSVLGPVKSQQDSINGGSFQYSGSWPAT